MRIYSIFVSLVILSMMVGLADAVTITVDDSGGANYTRIQDAVDNASAGDTIFVYNGSYIEQISITKNNISIIGESSNTTLIHGGWSADRVVDIQAENIYFSSFTISHSSIYGTGVHLQNTKNLTFTNNSVINNYYSMALRNSNLNIIESNNFSESSDIYLAYSSNNSFNSNTGSRIYIDAYSNKNRIESNKFVRITMSFYNSENVVKNNEVSEINIQYSSNNIIDGNKLSGYIRLESSNNNIIRNNTIPDNNNRYTGIRLYSSSNNLISANNITGGDYGIYLESNSKNNTISNNIIQGSNQYSIYSTWSGGNKAHLNIFNSLRNAYDHNGFNSWDNGTAGNYWSDYNGLDNDNNGIGDVPYLNIETNTGAKDNYPLIEPPCNCVLLPLPTPTTPGMTPSVTPIGDGFRVDPTITLISISDMIDAYHNGIIELFMNNPSLNDVNINVDIQINVPSGIHVYGEGFIQTVNPRVVNGTFNIPPGTTRIIPISIEADDTVRIGSHAIQFTGLYYPNNNKNNYKTFGQTCNVIVNEASVEPVSSPEYRYVWDASRGSNLTFTWTPINFDGFYYDLDNNAGNESLIIRLNSNTDRTINQNNLIYSTSPATIPFKYKPFGNYRIIGFIGEKYFIGYNSTGIINSSINLLNYHQLHKILEDDDTRKVVNVGNTLMLNEGYTLKINSVNFSEEPTVEISLLRYGAIIDNANISGGSRSYIYSKNIGTIANLPIIAIHIDQLFRNNETTVIYLKGIFQISENYISVNVNYRFGLMNVTHISNNGIIMKNSNEFTLSQDSIIDIVANLKFKVSDSNVLRFYLYNVDNFKRRGTISTILNNVTVWDALSFAGFFYNINYNLGTEKLSINTSGSDNRTIVKNALVYSTSVQQKPLMVVNAKHNNNGASAAAVGLEGFGEGKMAQTSGYYSIIGWQGEPYVAIKAKPNKLSRLLIEHSTSSSEKRTLSVGETWNIGGGYSLTTKSIDAKASPRQAWLILTKDGVKKDEKVVASGSIYTYVEKIFAGETDVPIFVTYIDSVFAGATTDMVQFRYTWLISSNITLINSGDRFDIFNVTKIDSKSIILKNENIMNLTAGNIPIMDTFNISVANSSDLRYYPSKLVISTIPSISYGGGGEGGCCEGIRYYRIYLKNGWNLISLPLIPLDSNDKENVSIWRITANINNSIIKIVSYNATALALGKPPWEVYYPGDTVNSTLKELKTGQGYFIKMNESIFLYIYGVRIYENTPRSYKMTQGWNLMGYHSISPIPVERALYNIQGDFSSLWVLKDDWRSYFGQQFNYMEPGYGYWIFMKKSGEVPQN